MPITNAGRNFMVSSTVTAASTPFNNANSYIAVGSGTNAAAFTDTALQTEIGRVGMDATYPQIATNVLTFRSTFGTAVANGAWNEWGVVNASTAGTFLNRKQEALGTKPSTQSWQFTCTLTINAA